MENIIKRISLTMALALCWLTLMTSLSSCEKKNTTPRFVHISVSCTQSPDVAITRANVDASTGGVGFDRGDALCVAFGGRYIGTLYYQDGLFSGEILEPDTEDYLEVFLLGNKQPIGLEPGKTTSCQIDISDQKNQLPVLAYGKSIIKWAGPDTFYFFILENMAGLVEFKLERETDCDMSLANVKTKAFINFSNPDESFTADEDSDGTVTLFRGTDDSKRLAILLPQPSEKLVVLTDNEKIPVSLPEIVANHGYVGDKAVRVLNDFGFSVSYGRKVLFAPGNLLKHYLLEVGDIYRFSGHPYDVAYFTIGNGSDHGIWRDAFDWGEWSGCNGTVDGTSGWRLLTNNEWEYLLGDNDARKGKFFWCHDHGVWGIALFPDNYSGPQPVFDSDGNITSLSNYYWDSNEKRYQRLLDAGMVFLPSVDVAYRSSSSLNWYYSYQWLDYWLADGSRAIYHPQPGEVYRSNGLPGGCQQAFVRFVKDVK